MPVSAPAAPMPLLFGRPTHVLGWQGFTAVLPENWNPAKFGGNRLNGDLRVDDEDGPRLELRWEANKGHVNVEKSVTDFLKRLEKDAKKRKQPFEIVEDVRLVSRGRKGKDQITSFAWRGGGEKLAGHGYGVAWSCPDCGRVTFGHLLGRAHEKPAKIERLATEIFGSLECHGRGGWETWSAFDLKLDVPEEFALGRAQMLLNKIELEWIRPKTAGLKGLGQVAERIAVRRFPIANVVLENESLENWANRTIRFGHKTLKLSAPEPTEVHGHAGMEMTGRPRDWRIWLGAMTFDWLKRRKTSPAVVQVWHCPVSNRLWVLETQVSNANAHVAADTLDSLECH